VAPTSESRGPGAGDMFFKVKGAKHGEINGEALDQKHKNEIEVLAWSWGMQGKSWLGDYSLALPAVGVVGTYVYFGLAMVLLTAGVQKIPTSLYDAARVDGAGAFREFLAVTLPALRGEIAVALTLTTIYALRNFDLVYNTTHGGPGDATTVPAFQVFSRAFESGQVGSAAAVGITLTAIIFVISLAINRFSERAA